MSHAKKCCPSPFNSPSDTPLPFWGFSNRSEKKSSSLVASFWHLGKSNHNNSPTWRERSRTWQPSSSILRTWKPTLPLSSCANSTSIGSSFQFSTIGYAFVPELSIIHNSPFALYPQLYIYIYIYIMHVSFRKLGTQGTPLSLLSRLRIYSYPFL
jgi:hypothetical protein